MTSESQKHIVFDIVSICVFFDAFHDAFERAIGPELLAQNINMKFSDSLG